MPTRPTNMTLRILASAALIAVAFAQVPDATKNVCKKPTSASDSPKGDYNDVCLEKAVFKKQNEKFDFNSAFVRESSFTDVVFNDADFGYAFWENTTFVNCEFKGTIGFDQALFVGLKFKDCVFKDRATFSQITMVDTKFEGTMFENGALFENADLTAVDFLNVQFEGDETLFDNVGIRGLNSVATNVDKWRWQFLDASDVSYGASEMKEFNCHEPLKEGEYVEARAEFNQTTFAGTTIEKVVCDQTIFRGTTLNDVKLGSGEHDMSSSNFTELTLSGVSSTDGCAKLDLSHSVIGSGVLKDVDLCEIDFTNTTTGTMDLSAIDVTDKKYKFRNAIFSGERIQGECCVDVCKKLMCKCDIKGEATDGCSRGNSRTNPNIDQSEDRLCFPGDATVELEGGARVPISSLAVGDSVLVGPGAYSRVFMFTHQTSSAAASFVALTTASGARLRLTGGHYVYADGALVAARDVGVGAELALASGETSRVAAVAREHGRGLYNPQTLHGDIVVDGVVASTYTAAAAPGAAHAALAPLRALFDRFGVPVAGFPHGLPHAVVDALPSFVSA